MYQAETSLESTTTAERIAGADELERSHLATLPLSGMSRKHPHHGHAPDMVFAHLITTPDTTTYDGRPIVGTSAASGQATLYYSSPADMTRDLRYLQYPRTHGTAGRWSGARFPGASL